MKHCKRTVSLLLTLALLLSLAPAVFAAEATFDVAGSNMTLGNSLVLNIMVKKADIKTTGLTAVLTHHAEEGDAVCTFRQSDWETYGSYYKFSVPVAAAQMTDQVSFQIVDGEGAVCNNPYSTSIQDYVGRIFAGSNDLTKTLMVDMLNYGTSAQKQFQYRQDCYADSILTEDMQALATDAITCTDARVRGDYYVGSNLSLEENILLNVIFNGISNPAGMTAKVEFTDVLGEEKASEAELTKYGNYGYAVTVDQIVLADASQLVKVSVLNADGSVYATACDSVESYIARMTSADDNGLYGNIMKFADSAWRYNADRLGISLHNWNTGELIETPTDLIDGKALYTCLDDGCGETKTETIPAGTTVYTRADLEAAVEQLSWDYLLKKDKIQYDSMELGAVGKYYGGKFLVTEGAAPEYGTSHTEINSVCSDYVWKVYEESLNYHLYDAESSLEAVTVDMWLHAEDQIRKSPEEDIDSCIVRWQSLAFTDEEKLYGVPDSPHFVETKEEVFAYFLNWQTMLRPGDVLVDKGHALIYAGSGKVLHCNGLKYQPTTGVLNHEDNGSVYGVSPLSCTDTSWLNTRANSGRLIVFRPTEFLVTKDTDGDLSNDMVRDPNFTMPEDTVSRMEFPGIEIDRTVNITPYGTAAVGEEITYTVKITNRSNDAKYLAYRRVTDAAFTGENFEGVTVTETVPEGTEFISATEGGSYDETTNTVTWELDLAAGKSVSPAYTVKVTGKIGSTIVNGGGFVENIPSNTICNRIGGEKMNEFAAMLLQDLAKNVETWDFGSGLNFAEKVYEAAETGLSLPTVSEVVDDLFVWTKAIGALRNPSTRYPKLDPIDVFMLREDADMDMVIGNYYGGYRFFTGDDAIGSTISEFRFDYLELGDIIVNCDTENGEVIGVQVMVYAGNETLLICHADGSYEVLKGTAAKQQLWNSFLQTNELFFALRPSQAGDLKAAHTWDDGEITKAPTCGETGEMTYRCLDDGCDATKVKTLDKTTDHSWNDHATDNKNGTHTLVCGDCGETLSKLHTWDEGTASEEDPNKKAFTCTACGATKTEFGGLSEAQTALLQSFTYHDGSMAAAANSRQRPVHFADSIYAAMCMDGLAELFNGSLTAAGVLGQAFKNTVSTTGYGPYDRAYVLRTEANGYLEEAGTVYQVPSMVVDGFYGGTWLLDENGSRLDARAKELTPSDLQVGDVLLLGENTAQFTALLWVLVYQGQVDGQDVFLFGNTYYGSYHNVGDTMSYRGKLCFNAEEGTLEEAVFNSGITSTGTVVDVTMEAEIGKTTFQDFLTSDLVSGVVWEYFYAIRPSKLLGEGTHTWDGDTCTVCGATKTEQPHTCYGAYTDNGNGTHTFTCQTCGEETVEAHTWDNGEPIENGMVYTCTLCDGVRTEVTEPEEPEILALTDAQIEALQKLTYHRGSMAAGANSRQRPVHFADTVYAAIGLDGLVEKFNGGLTAAAVLNQGFKNISGKTGFGATARDYILRTEDNGYLEENGTTYHVPSMLVDGFYGGSWLVDADGNRMTDAAENMDLDDLQPGDVLLMGENTGSYDALLWVLVYQGNLDGQETFIFGNTYYGSNYTNVPASVSYRGKVCFDAETEILTAAVFNNAISSTGTVVDVTMEAEIGTTTFNDFLANDLVSGVAWEYFYAIRPGTIMN